MSHHALRALLRLERRYISQNRLRSLLIVLLVAIPTAAMIGGSAMITAITRTVEDQRHQAMGLATIRLEDSEGLSIEEALASIPPDATTALLEAGVSVVARPGQRLRARSFHVAPSAVEEGGLASTMLRIDAGRAPSLPAEVAVSSGLLQTLHLGLNGTVEIDGSPATITGIASVPEELSLPVILLAPTDEPSGGRRSLLVGLPAAQAQTLGASWSARAAHSRLRTDTGSSDSFESLVVFVCGTFGFFEAALIIGAAIAVGMRRRQRELGLLGSNGAEQRPMVLALLTSTGALAALGSVIGLGLGALGAYIVHPHLSGWMDRDVGAFELPPRFIIGSFVLGVGAAVLSAWLPARSAVRLPIRVALSGRRPIQSGSRGFLRAGAALVTVGTLCIGVGSLSPGKLSGLAILMGAIVFVLGLGTLSPWILELLARGAGRLPIPWRLAVRDAGRFRARNGPVVTAVIAGMSISVLLGCIGASVQKAQGAQQPLLGTHQLGVSGPTGESLAHALQEEFGGEVSVAPTRTIGHGERTRTAPTSWIVELPVPATRELAEDAISMAAAYRHSSIAAASLEPASEQNVFRVVLWICIGTGLIVIFVATTLSSVESATDAKVLHTVGAAPRVLRQHAASRAGYLALLGCALAVPAGLLPMAGLLRLSGGVLEFVTPWSTILTATLVMPFLGYMGTAAAAMVRPPGQA